MTLYLGIIYDAMRALGFKDDEFYINIKPKAGYEKLISGPALTTLGRKVSPNENYKELDNIRLQIYKPKLFIEKPIVLLQSNDDYVAHSGDITSMIYQKLGAIGFITDGNVRDIELINELSFPCFCEGINPIDALDYWALTEFNVPVEVKGVDVCPGDMLYASKDGVIRVKRQNFLAFQEKLTAIHAKEIKIREIISKISDANTFTDEFEAFVERHGRW